MLKKSTQFRYEIIQIYKYGFNPSLIKLLLSPPDKKAVRNSCNPDGKGARQRVEQINFIYDWRKYFNLLMNYMIRKDYNFKSKSNKSTSTATENTRITRFTWVQQWMHLPRKSKAVLCWPTYPFLAKWSRPEVWRHSPSVFFKIPGVRPSLNSHMW